MNYGSTVSCSCGAEASKHSAVTDVELSFARLLLCCGAVAVRLPDAGTGNCAPDNYGVWRPR